MAKNTQKKLSGAQKIGMGVGLTAAAVAAAGAYFLYGSKEAAQNRKKVKSWALKAKADVLEALEKAEHITKEEYDALVDIVGGTYSKFKSATAGEIKDFKKEMHDHWKNIEKSGAIQKAASAVTKVVKSSPRKSVKKATPKKAAKKTGVKKTAK